MVQRDAGQAERHDHYNELRTERNTCRDYCSRLRENGTRRGPAAAIAEYVASANPGLQWHMYVRDIGWLLLFRITRSAGTRTADKQVSPIGERNRSTIRPRRPVLGAISRDDDLSAKWQGIPPPTLPNERVRGTAFDAPVRHLPIRAFHIDVKPRVGINPFNFGDRST